MKSQPSREHLKKAEQFLSEFQQLSGRGNNLEDLASFEYFHQERLELKDFTFAVCV